MKNVLVICILLLFFSCKNEVKQSEINADTTTNESIETLPVSDNSQTSLDWQGTYKGVTPCADCEGIETEITLNHNLTYSIKTKYLGKGDGKIFEETGQFDWDSTGEIINLKGLKGSPSKYKVGENQLIQLDMEGNRITGNLAEKYILKK